MGTQPAQEPPSISAWRTQDQSVSAVMPGLDTTEQFAAHFGGYSSLRSAAEPMDRAKEEVLAPSAFPREHWRQIWSTNSLERLNKELNRRCRVVGIFPN